MVKDTMFQRLCSTSTWKALGFMHNTSNYHFMCFRASFSTQRFSYLICFRAYHSTQHKHSCALEILAQHNINTHVLQSFSPYTTFKYSCVIETLAQHSMSVRLKFRILHPSLLRTTPSLVF